MNESSAALTDSEPSPVLQGETTLAIVLGASEWPSCPDFEDLPSCRRSAEAVAEYLQAKDGLSLPPCNVQILIDLPELAPAVLKEMRIFVRGRRNELAAIGKPVTDLLFYYVGHGGFSASDAFFISLRSTDSDDPIATSITVDSLAGLVRDTAGGLRTYLVLDCCYAASAAKGFLSGGPVEATVAKFRDVLWPQSDALAFQAGRLPTYGTALLCASGSRQRAKAPADLAYTMFTAGMLEILKQGEPTAPLWLSLNDLQQLVQRHLEARFADEAILPQGTCAAAGYGASRCAAAVP